MIFERIEDLAVKTILSIENLTNNAFEMNVPYRNNCFELFGFDILIDEDSRPWLLEVNMSPACAERAPFLSKMLDDMAESLLKIVIDDEVECN